MPRATLALAAAAVSAQDAWQPVREAIDNFDLIPGATLTVGTAGGAVFRHTKGGVTEDTEQEIFSATKWVVGAAIMREAQDGRLDIDEPIHNHLPYWTRDRRDSRSGITLRHLLGFASGYTDITQMNGFTLPLACVTQDIQGCAEAVYNNVAHNHAPGSIIDYNSIHLQLAGAAAERALGERILAVIERNVFRPAGMAHTRFGQRDSNPFLAGGIVSTPRDYFGFLGKVFGDELLSRATNDRMMSDAYPAASKSGIFELIAARYGLTNWYECPVLVGLTPWVWTRECEEARIHTSPGASGAYPLIDRRNGYYYYFGYDGVAGAGAVISGGFRDVLKPLVDAAVAGRAPNSTTAVAPGVAACLRRAAAEAGAARMNATQAMAFAASRRC